MRIIQEARRELRAINRVEIDAMIAEIMECPVLRSYCDVCVDAAEQIDVFVLGTNIEKRLLRQEMDRFSGISPRRTN